MKLLELIKKQFELRIFEESIPRINKVLDILTEDQLWYTPNKHVNSIGNLILHLCGNVTQWIGSGLGGLPDNRERSLEFSRSGHQTKKELSESLDQLIKLTRPIIQELSMDQLEEAKNVQGFDETGISILIHVIEHFSYHTGQIAQMAKIIKEKDLGFYEGMDLEIKN